MNICPPPIDFLPLMAYNLPNSMEINTFPYAISHIEKPEKGS